ncbi:phosphopantetheine-binding protein [Facklamia languida]
MEIINQFINILNENGIQINEDNLDYSLDFDSLKYMELLIILEQEFFFNMDEYDFVNVKTYRELLSVLEGEAINDIE